jgi:predicted RND superfamily exporter protein
MRKISEKLARFIERHPLWFVIIASVITIAAVPGLTMLETETGFSALVSPEAEISVDNARYQEQFGGDSIHVLLTGSVDDLFSPQNLAVLSRLEKEISENDKYISVNSPLMVLEMAIVQA